VATPVDGKLRTRGFTRPEHFSLDGLTAFDMPAETTVPANGSLELLLSYRPLVAGRDDGWIQFEYCGIGCGLLVQVRASAASSDLRVDPAFLDFGTVMLGGESTLQLQVFNESSGPLEVSSLGVSSTEVQAQAAQPLPIVVAPGASTAIAVTYHPSGPG